MKPERQPKETTRTRDCARQHQIMRLAHAIADHAGDGQRERRVFGAKPADSRGCRGTRPGGTT